MAKANLSADAEAIVKAVNDLRGVVEDLYGQMMTTNSRLGDLAEKIEAQTKDLKDAIYTAADR